MSFGSLDEKNVATLRRENSFTICNRMDFFLLCGVIPFRQIYGSTLFKIIDSMNREFVGLTEVFTIFWIISSICLFDPKKLSLTKEFSIKVFLFP